VNDRTLPVACDQAGRIVERATESENRWRPMLWVASPNRQQRFRLYFYSYSPTIGGLN
jgi:hypothetical protein